MPYSEPLTAPGPARMLVMLNELGMEPHHIAPPPFPHHNNVMRSDSQPES